MIHEYDYAFAGAGLAAYSLLHALLEAELPPARVLLIDPRAAAERTIGFWSRAPIGLESHAQWSWPGLAIADHQGQRSLDAGSLRYFALRASAVRERVLDRARASGWTVEHLRARVDVIDSTPESALLSTDSGVEIHARWAFDSRLPETLRARVFMWQSFDGAHIELDEPDSLDTGSALFMDLRLPPRADALEFGQMLPIGPRQAVVYRIRIGATRAEVLDLDDYLRGTLGLARARILAHERGHLLLTDARFDRRASARVLRIGLAGGRLRASTGYAFSRMQRDSLAIARSLVEHGHPFRLPREPKRFRWLDAVMLAWLARHPERASAWFGQLFERAPAELVFRMLDEQASWWELLKIVRASLGHGLGWSGLRRAISWPRRPSIREVSDAASE